MNTTTLQYLENLFKEYKEVKGIELPINTMLQNPNYLKWLEARKYYLAIYKECLNEVIGMKNIILELDKGNLDSISDKSSNLILLTKYVDTFKDIYHKEEDNREIIRGNLKKSNDGIIIEAEDRTLRIPRFNNYCVTSNPYNFRVASSNLKLLSEQGFNILMGIYGYLGDKNLDYKLNKLKEFQELVSGNLYQRTINNSYVAFVKKKGNMK